MIYIGKFLHATNQLFVELCKYNIPIFKTNDKL